MKPRTNGGPETEEKPREDNSGVYCLVDSVISSSCSHPSIPVSPSLLYLLILSSASPPSLLVYFSLLFFFYSSSSFFSSFIFCFFSTSLPPHHDLLSSFIIPLSLLLLFSFFIIPSSFPPFSFLPPLFLSLQPWHLLSPSVRLLEWMMESRRLPGNCGCHGNPAPELLHLLVGGEK